MRAAKSVKGADNGMYQSLNQIVAMSLRSLEAQGSCYWG